MAGYRLGVDLGTTWTAAAVRRDGQTTVVSLSQRSQAIPTVVHLGADGTVLVGDAAVRRGTEEPERLAREMKRRIGDPTPVLLGGEPWSPELLQARVLRWVVDHVTAEQGGPPETITVTHPANWGPYKLDLLAQAIRQAGILEVELLPEPVAAAAWYATQHRVADGAVIAVYDLGGGTFDTAVVRRSGDGFELLGQPDGVERLGGIDFDAAVLAHVVSQIADEWRRLDPDDPEVVADAAALRDHCVEAKEALSSDTTVSIPVRLPAVRTTVRLTRDELEGMLRGPLGETVTAVRRTLVSAGLEPGQIDAVLLVGGSSRIPLVAQLVSTALGVGVAVDTNPKFAVALGAALGPALPAGAATAPVVPAFPAAPVAPPTAPDAPDAPAMPAVAPPGNGHRRWPLIGAASLVAVALGAAAFTFLGDGGSGDDEDAGSSGTTAPDPSDLPAGDGVLRIGVLAPLSGDDSFLAPAMQAAAELAVEDVNAAGGVLGEPVELVVEDAGGDVDSVAGAFESLIDQDVDFVVGPVAAEQVVETRQLVVDEERAACSAHDVAIETLFDDDGRYVRTIPSQELEAAALVDAVIEGGHTVVGLAAPDDATEYTDSLASRLEDAGITIDGDVRFERGSLDPLAVVSQLNSTGSTAWILAGSAELADVVVEGNGAGLRGPFFADDTFEDEAVGRRIAEDVEGGSDVATIGPEVANGVDEPGTAASRVGEALASSDDAFPFAAPFVYDCVVLAAATAESAGSDHPDALAALLVETSRSGETCFAVECLALAADGVDIDYEGESGTVDLDDDGEVTDGLFNRQRWQPDATLAFEETFEVEG